MSAELERDEGVSVFDIDERLYDRSESGSAVLFRGGDGPKARALRFQLQVSQVPGFEGGTSLPLVAEYLRLKGDDLFVDERAAGVPDHMLFVAE